MVPFKPVFILLSCISLHSFLYAQSDGKEGYYIDPKGDTVFGKILDYSDNVHNPAKIEFQHASDMVIDLRPETCRKVAIKDFDTYISYTGKRLLNATNYLSADVDTADKYEDITVFLRERFNDGHYKLYELFDHKRTNLYISEGDGPLTELYFKEYQVGGDTVRASDVFKRQLFAFFANNMQKSPHQTDYIERVSYDAKNMATLFAEITGQKTQNNNNRTKFPLQLFIGAGFSSNMFNVTGDINAVPNVIGSYGSQTTPVFEAGVKIYSQRNGGKLFVMGRLRYYKFENEKDFDYSYAPYDVKTTYKASVFSIPLSIGYRLIVSDVLSIEPSLGVAADFLSSPTQSQWHASTSVTTTGPTGGSMVFQPFGELALTIKKRLSFVADYYIPSDIGTFISYRVDHSSFTFGARVFIF